VEDPAKKGKHPSPTGELTAVYAEKKNESHHDDKEEEEEEEEEDAGTLYVFVGSGRTLWCGYYDEDMVWHGQPIVFDADILSIHGIGSGLLAVVTIQSQGTTLRDVMANTQGGGSPGGGPAESATATTSSTTTGGSRLYLFRLVSQGWGQGQQDEEQKSEKNDDGEASSIKQCFQQPESVVDIPCYTYDLCYFENRLLVAGLDGTVHAFDISRAARSGMANPFTIAPASCPREFQKFPTNALAMSTLQWNRHNYVAMGGQNGFLRVSVSSSGSAAAGAAAAGVSSASSIPAIEPIPQGEDGNSTFSHIFDGPVSAVHFFPVQPADRQCDVYLVVGLAMGEAIVYKAVNRSGLHVRESLDGSKQHDSVLSVLAADTDFDGCMEVLVGTYDGRLLVFSPTPDAKDPSVWSWKPSFSRLFDAPIHGLSSVDVTRDGLEEILITSSSGVRILQADLPTVVAILQERERQPNPAPATPDSTTPVETTMDTN